MTSPSTGRADSLAARLARIAERASSGTDTDAAVREAILVARARTLAIPRALQDDTASRDRMPVILFLVGTERLAMPLDSIVAIIPAAIVTPLPRAVAPVYGVMAWRARPLTVLSIATASADAQRRVLVLGDGRRAVAGLLVDAVDETRILARAALSPAPDGARSRMALGVTDDAILVLDADALLTMARPEP